MKVHGMSASGLGVSTLVVLAAARIGSAQPAGPPPPTPTDGPPDGTAQQPEPAQPALAPTAVERPMSPREHCLELRRQIVEKANKTPSVNERIKLLDGLPKCNATEKVAPAPPVQASKEGLEPTVAPNATGGFALEVRLDSGQQLDANSMMRSTQAGFFLGHRGSMTTLGLGFDFGHLSAGSMFTGNAKESSSMLLVMPGVRVVLARTNNERTELIGQLDAGYGRIWAGGSNQSMSSPSVNNVRVQLAPGLRYWLAPSFAIGGAAGLRYELYKLDAPGATAAEVTSVFSSIQLTGVF